MSHLKFDILNMKFERVVSKIFAFKDPVKFSNLSKISKTLVLCTYAVWSWPSRSPDLTVCDFFLWDYLKQQIWEVPHDQQFQNLGELREDGHMIQRPFDSMLTRATKCVVAGGN